MVTQFPTLGSRRAVIDRRLISDRLDALAHEHRGDPVRLRALVVQELKTALDQGRAEIARRLEARPTKGRESVSAFAFLRPWLHSRPTPKPKQLSATKPKQPGIPKGLSPA